MNFEHRDPDGGLLRIRSLPGIAAVLIKTGPQGCAVPVDLMPDVIAGARDTARTAAGAPPVIGSSVQHVIEHALTVYYQDSSAPSAVARALLAQHRAEILREHADEKTSR